MDRNSPVFDQFCDYRLNRELEDFVRRWKECNFIDDEAAGLIRGDIRDELDRRRNGYLNEMNRLIKNAFHYQAPRPSDHPDELLWDMLRGNF